MGLPSSRQNTALQVAKESPDLGADMARAEQLHRSGRTAEAEAAYRQIVERHPSAGAAWSALSLLILDSGDLPSAIACLETALSHDRKNPVYWRNLCELKRRRGDLTGALLAGRKARRLAPDDAKSMYNLSIALGDRGEYDKAIALLRKLLAQTPFHDRAWNNLGHFLMNQGALSRQDRPSSGRWALTRAMPKPTTTSPWSPFAMAISTPPQIISIAPW